MTQTELIIFLIWVVGIIFNLIMINKIFPNELDSSKGGDIFDIFLIFFMLPIIFLQYLLKVVFVMGSWMSWIAIGIMCVVEKIEEWHDSNTKKKKV